MIIMSFNRLMAIYAVLLALFFFFTAGCAGPSAQVSNQRANDDRALDQAYRAVVQLAIYEDKDRMTVGSGVIIGTDMVLTAAHVCTAAMDIAIMAKDKMRMVAYQTNGKRYKASQRYYMNSDRDICLVTVPGVSVKDAIVISRFMPKVRDDVVIIGGPAGLFPIETRGKLMALPYTHSSHPAVSPLDMLSCQAFGGNSGGPVVNSKGELIGILVMGMPRYPQVSFSVNLKDIYEFLRHIR